MEIRCSAMRSLNPGGSRVFLGGQVRSIEMRARGRKWGISVGQQRVFRLPPGPRGSADVGVLLTQAEVRPEFVQCW